MSALIGVRSDNTITLMTDAATVRTTDGYVAKIGSKQAPLDPVNAGEGMVAWTGWTPPALLFIAMARKLDARFDALVDGLAPKLWRQVQQESPVPRDWMVYSMLLAGWSESRKQLELYSLDDDVAPNGAELVVTAAGMGKEHDGLCRDFCRRFAQKPEMFDPVRDGVSFMEDARRRHTQQFDHGPPRHVVGGFVECTQIFSCKVLTRTILHRWPDTVGSPIELEDSA